MPGEANKYQESQDSNTKISDNLEHVLKTLEWLTAFSGPVAIVKNNSDKYAAYCLRNL